MSKLELPYKFKGFKQVKCPYGTLVTPLNSKWKWDKSERWYRSAIINDNNEVVSVGFPKFGNFNEPSFVEDQSVIEKQILSNKKVWASFKLDGSLLIRSVINGKVVFRTRGNWKLDSFDKSVHNTIKELGYDILYNPGFACDSSLLFEFIHPAHQIVLSYNSASITLIGAVKHNELKLYNYQELKELSQDANLKLVDNYQIGNNYKDLKKEIKNLQGLEGIVLRSEDGQHLIKLKSSSYLTMHRLKTQMSIRNIYSIIIDKKFKNINQWEEYNKKQGIDWELYNQTKPLASSIFNAKDRANKEFKELDDIIDEITIKFIGQKNKQIEYINNNYNKTYRQSLLALLDGNQKAGYNSLENYLITEVLLDFYKNNNLNKANENLEELLENKII